LAGTAWGNIATAVDVIGEVARISSDGVSNTLNKGDQLKTGETVKTDDGRAELHFTDGGKVKLARFTTFRIDNFNYTGSEDGTERGFFSLLRGGLRTLTGAIGQKNKENYQMDGQVATLGLRGTAYLLRLCQGDCGSLGDGLYTSVKQGKVFLRNKGAIIKELDVPAGKSAYVATPETIPEIILPPPQLLIDDLNTTIIKRSSSDPKPAWFGNIHWGQAATQPEKRPVKKPPPPVKKSANQDDEYNPLDDPAFTDPGKTAMNNAQGIAGVNQVVSQFLSSNPTGSVQPGVALPAPVSIPGSYSQPTPVASPEQTTSPAATSQQQGDVDDEITRMADPGVAWRPPYVPPAEHTSPHPPAGGSGTPTKIACNATTKSGGNQAASYQADLGTNSGSFDFTYNMMSVPDRMVLTYQRSTLLDTGCVGNRQGAGKGTGTRSVSFSGNSSTVTVQVIPSCEGGSTSWNFTLKCPVQ